MFTIDPKITEKDLKGKSIFKVLISMNNHQVATPEMSLEEARSYVFFIREGRNRLSAYIALHLLLTDRKLVYAHSANPFLEEQLLKIEDEARDFAEYLGAMMDEVDFASMSDLEQDKWIEDQGIFSTKTPPEVAEAVPAPAPASAPETPAAPEPPIPAVETKSAPQPPAASSVPPVPKTYPVETKEPTRDAPVTATVRKDVPAQAPPRAAAKQRQETLQKEPTTGIDTPKQTAKKISFSATSVVGRDREALARLLTSF
jgi:outer membrane biosynthesis protein TonB